MVDRKTMGVLKKNSSKLHNKENSTNSQNTERPPQKQQCNQDEETEECPAGKGTGEMLTKPNKRGRDREST